DLRGVDRIDEGVEVRVVRDRILRNRRRLAMGRHGSHPFVYVARRETRAVSFATNSFVPHITTTVPVEASFTYAISGALGSPAGTPPAAFSVTCRIVGAAATAATAAAPTAVFFRKFRRDIPDSSSAMCMPSVPARGAEPLPPRLYVARAPERAVFCRV